MAKTTKEQLAVLARPFAEALVRTDDARRAAVIDHVTGGGRTVRLDRATGTLSPVKVSILDDSQVQVEPNDLSNARNLEDLLADIVAYILAMSVPSVTTEDIRDAVAAMFVAGTNITLTEDDGADTLTIAATGAAYTSENARDDIAAMLAAGTGISLSYNDAGDVLTITATGGGGGGASYPWIDDNEQPAEYPAIPDSVDDEFEDGTLDPAWTIVNDPAGADAVSESQHAGFVHVGLAELPSATDTFDQLVRMHRTAPAGTATASYVVRGTVAGSQEAYGLDGGEFAGFEVYLGNPVNDEAVAAGMIFNIGNLALPLVSDAMNVTAGGLNAMTTLRQLPITPGQLVYFKLEKATANAYTSANTYNAYLSGDGVIWHVYGTVSKTFTTDPTEFGIIFRRPKSQLGTVRVECLVDFIRKTA